MAASASRVPETKAVSVLIAGTPDDTIYAMYARVVQSKQLNNPRVTLSLYARFLLMAILTPMGTDNELELNGMGNQAKSYLSNLCSTENSWRSYAKSINSICELAEEYAGMLQNYVRVKAFDVLMLHFIAALPSINDETKKLHAAYYQEDLKNIIKMGESKQDAALASFLKGAVEQQSALGVHGVFKADAKKKTSGQPSATVDNKPPKIK